MVTFIVRYAEIALKGRNREPFEEQLAANIRRRLGLRTDQITRQWGQFLIEVDESEAEEARRALGGVFGIAWYAETIFCPCNPDAIGQAALHLIGDKLGPGQTFAVATRRSYKQHPFTSADVNRQVGALIETETGAGVDLDNPDLTVRISVRREHTYLFTEKVPGPGGLPVRTGGHVLALLSGGFDSIAASYLLAKRGAQVDFLHFHVFPRSEGVMQTKLPAIWRALGEYTLSRHVLLASYAPFQFATLNLTRRQAHYELVIFRRLMVRVAEKIAQAHHYQAIVLGDSLGQVASQTIDNIGVVDAAVQMSIFRPCIGMDKVEVIDLVNHIGLEELAAAPYKDCCSIISRNPATHARLEVVEEMEREIGVEGIVEEIADSVERIAPWPRRVRARP